MSSNEDVSRREFLARMAAAGLAVPALAHETPAFAQGTPAAPGQPLVGRMPRRVLTQSDFNYLGCFRLPTTLSGQGDPAWGRGLAHRWVNGQLRFFHKAHGNPPPAKVYEVIAPALSPSPVGAQTAKVSRIWGDIRGNDDQGELVGLMWDEQDRRLYWATGNTYNATTAYDPSVGYSTLDDNSGTYSNKGIWGFTGRSYKMAMGGILDVPQWFSDAYCRGSRFAAGFGGYWSVATMGPVSIGPALTAFDPKHMASTPSRGSIAHTELLGYPFNPKPYTDPQRAQRDTDYVNEFDHWNPKNGVGYWSWTDYVWQGGIWVDTPTKTGVLFFPSLGNGRTYYFTSTLWAERMSHGWFVYDPSDLAAVAQGAKKQWEPQPKSNWLVNYPGITYPVSGWKDEPKTHVVGTTYDKQTQTLYVAVRFAFGLVTGSPTVVYAYEVA